jgi:hypothetical protein
MQIVLYEITGNISIYDAFKNLSENGNNGNGSKIRGIETVPALKNWRNPADLKAARIPAAT